MKRPFTKVLSFFLCIFIMLPVSGCQNMQTYPEGYTAGMASDSEHILRTFEIHWFETYDELITAMNKLLSHGSTFCSMLIPSYETELMDAKYCVTWPRRTSEKIKKGEDLYNRKVSNVKVSTYIFLDDVSMDELMYSDPYSYKTIEFVGCFDGDSKGTLMWGCLENEQGEHRCRLKYGKNTINISFFGDINPTVDLPVGFHDDFLAAIHYYH